MIKSISARDISRSMSPCILHPSCSIYIDSNPSPIPLASHIIMNVAQVSPLLNLLLRSPLVHSFRSSQMTYTSVPTRILCHTIPTLTPAPTPIGDTRYSKAFMFSRLHFSFGPHSLLRTRPHDHHNTTLCPSGQTSLIV